jgi:hypothetical protein
LAGNPARYSVKENKKVFLVLLYGIGIGMFQVWKGTLKLIS